MSVMPEQADPYFRAQRIDTSGGRVEVSAGFAIVLVTEGHGILVTNLGSFEVARGEVALMPFAAGDWALEGSCVAVACRPPDVGAPDGP